MIAATVEELAPLIGTRPACRALGASPATIYRRRGRRRRPPEPKPPRPRPAPARALTGPERERVLEALHCERFVDVSPEETYATLLDEGTYLCSTRTMYRILAAHHGGVRERRDQLTHPAYAKPELLATRPNELWSWDVSKLKGPAKWTYFYLYVILDVFSPLHRRLDGPAPRDRPARKSTDRAGQRAAEDHPQGPHAARRSRRAAARQAGRVPARRSRHHQDA
jgi:putative transposase